MKTNQGHGHGHAHLDCCGTTFHGAAAFDDHQARAHGRRTFSCECGASFGAADARAEHARREHGA